MKEAKSGTMKKVCFIIIMLCFSFISRAQDVVKWEIRCEKKAGKTYELHFTPKVQDSWHIYSLGASGWMDNPTRFSFEENPLVILKGGVKEIGLQEDFVQEIKLKRRTKTVLKGTITFKACSDEQCMPPQTVKFMCEIGSIISISKMQKGYPYFHIDWELIVSDMEQAYSIWNELCKIDKYPGAGDKTEGEEDSYMKLLADYYWMPVG